MKPTGQKPFYYYLFFVLMLLGCENVVDQELDMLEGGISATYSPQSALTGDSLTVSGRLHMDQSPVITLGGVEADYVHKGTEVRDDATTQATYEVETVRFLITPGMGEGRQPLEIQSGDHNQTLYVDILARAELDSRPDTTLIVEELYRDPSDNWYDFTGRSVTDDGTIYLQSSEGLYRYQDGQFQNILAIDDPLTIDGEEVHVKKHAIRPDYTRGNAVSGIAANANNNTLYLSVYTDMGSDEGHTGAWLLLKTDPDLNQMEIVNRTWHDRVADSIEVAPGFWFVSHDNNYSPSEILDNGPIENTKLTGADELYIDEQNRLLFHNPEMEGYYARLETNGRITAFGAYDDQVYYTPGASRAFILPDNGQENSRGMTLYDMEYLEPMAVVPPFYEWSLLSFEDNTDWKYNENFQIFNAKSAEPFDFLGLPNGELLDMGRLPSIGALNPTTTGIYTYAGTEKGYQYGVQNDEIPQQNQLTGLAKFVNFNGFTTAEGTFAGDASIIGLDKDNNIYFLRAVDQGLRIYRLGKP